MEGPWDDEGHPLRVPSEVLQRYFADARPRGQTTEGLFDALREAIHASDEQLIRMGAAGAALVKQNHNAATEAAKLSEKFAELTRQFGI